MTTYVVTKGPIEQAMVKRLLREHPILRRRDIQVLVRERSTLTSVARTILSTRHEPVAVILDTKTMDPGAILEQRHLAEWHVGAAGLREEWEIVQGVPEFAVLLFQDEDALRSLLPVSLSFEQRIVARYEPKRVLTEVFAQAGKPYPEALVRRIARTRLSHLWKLPVLQPLERFLHGGSQAQHAGDPA
ncbi:hypothetical protein [Hyalangium gracile]|uniref:hypothetical protein n=1 Tax=Hyalangium gracile TaxID=394092 RepID=UPI001CCF3B26|nr:hypothetical protein [Hyalangium gracile]